MDADVPAKVLEWLNARRATKGHAPLEIEQAVSAAGSTEADTLAQGSASVAALSENVGHYVDSGITEPLNSIAIVAPKQADVPLTDFVLATLTAVAGDGSISELIDTTSATHCGVSISLSEQHQSCAVVVNFLSRLSDVVDAAGTTAEASKVQLPVSVVSAATGSSEPAADGAADAPRVLPSIPISVLVRGGAQAVGARLLPASAGLASPHTTTTLSVPVPGGSGEAAPSDGEPKPEGQAEEAKTEAPTIAVGIRAPLDSSAAPEAVWEGGQDCVAAGSEGTVTIHVPLAACLEKHQGATGFVLHVLGTTGQAAAPAPAPVEGEEKKSEEGDAQAAVPAAQAGPAGVIARLFIGIGEGEAAPVGLSSSAAAADLPDVSSLGITTGGFSELAVVAGEGQGAPDGFTPVQVPVRVTAAAPVQGPLALSLAVVDNPSLPRVCHLLLVSGSTPAEAQEACPDGYEVVPLDLAQEGAVMLGGVQAQHKPSAAAAEGQEGEQPAAAAPQAPAGLAADPSHAFLAVLRGSGQAVVHSSLAAVVCPAVTEGHPAMPAVLAPAGYTLQIMDVAVRVPVGEPEASGEEGALPIQRTGVAILRLMLLQSVDVEAAQQGASLVVRAEDEPDELSSDQSGTVAGEGAFVSLAEMMAEGAAEADEEPDEEAILREKQELVAAIKAAREQQHALREAQESTQTLLAAWLAMRQANSDEKDAQPAAAPDNDRAAAAAAFAAADKARRYQAALDAFTAERAHAERERLKAETTALSLQAQVDAKDAVLNDIRSSFNAFKREIARGALHGHTGKPIPRSLLDKYEEQEAIKEDELARVQLRFFAAQAAVNKLEGQMAAKDKLADGLALMDFEQLKIENATLAEKIEDRTNEINKLRKKTTGAVQVLTHVREKLQFVSAEVSRLSAELLAVEQDVSSQRLTLAHGKKEREKMRFANSEARHAQGFAYVDRLAIDYERRKREVLTGKETLSQLQHEYATKQQISNFADSTLTSVAKDIVRSAQ